MMTAKSARGKNARISKGGVRILSGKEFWTEERRKAAWASTKPVKGEREFFKFMEAEMAARER
jgi:hypothetical protein